MSDAKPKLEQFAVVCTENLNASEAFSWNEAPRYMIRDRDRILQVLETARHWRRHFLGTVTLYRIPTVCNRNKRGRSYAAEDHEVRKPDGGMKVL